VAKRFAVHVVLLRMTWDRPLQPILSSNQCQEITTPQQLLQRIWAQYKKKNFQEAGEA
jgi:poly-beta-hydroxyalkanoate depolymerase